jgi:hypothetical protein
MIIKAIMNPMICLFKDYPSVYNDAINWMRTQGAEGSFRYLLVPQSHSSQLILPNNYPYQFLALSGSSYAPTYDYVHSTYDLLSKNNSSTVSSLLADANVKFVIVVKNTSDFFKSIFAKQTLLHYDNTKIRKALQILFF